MWTYGLQLRGFAKKSNLNKIQTFQNKILSTSLMPYMFNFILHTGFNIKTVHAETITFYNDFI